MFKIALDAGHGMNTPGKRCLKSLDKKETREWYLNDRIADKLEKKLSMYNGYQLVRVDDTTGVVDVSLSRRVERANDFGADFYLSIHHNAGVNGKSGGGLMSIVYTKASTKSREYQKLIYDELMAKTGLRGNRSEPCPKQNLQVLRETNMPSVLIECGFMDSSTDVPIILSEEFAEATAEGLKDALVKIGNLVEKKEGCDVECDSKFIDTKGCFAEKEIDELFKMGIVNGKTQNQFFPNEPVTRAEAAVLIRRAIKFITGK